MEEYMSIVTTTNSITGMSYQANYVSLAHLPVQGYPCDPPQKKQTTAKCCQKEEETTMYTQDETKNYLSRRLSNVANKLDRALYKQFGLANDPTPRTGAEIVAAIQSGKFIVPDTNHDYGFSSIEWRDPSVKKDNAGYKTARDAMLAQQTTVEDAIMVKTADEALTALTAFEGWTFTAPTTTTTQ